MALAGAGGKTSLMWHLTGRLADRGCRVAATTTTRVRAGEEPAGTPVLSWRGGSDPVPDLEDALARGAPPLVTSGRMDGGKHIGLTPGQVDELAARVDHLIVEADGARGLPLKLPREGEPVLPSSATHLVVVVGLAALGRPAGPDTCLGTDGLVEEGAVLDPDRIRSLLLGPGGYLEAASRVDHAFIAVNGDDEDACTRLADTLWHPSLEGVIASSAIRHRARLVTNGGHRIAALVLAAGRSERLPPQKLALPLRGVPLVRRALEAALGGCDGPVFLVTGHEAESVCGAAGDALDDPRVTVVHNPRAGDGMSSSL
ncbi:MAG: putative selenium-dependent hydroxylase accessory protein YqeC, partial [Deltaproteobacteria bacterium]|nr:putative selenium-dependent hydroxylase accessory protein YqeC [Deltaproteobacteria bacterium]